MKALQAPFDERHKETVTNCFGEGGSSEYTEAAYQQGMDQVLVSWWDVEHVGLSFEITVCLGDRPPIVRTGATFSDACKMFGIGRYHNFEDDSDEEISNSE